MFGGTFVFGAGAIGSYIGARLSAVLPTTLVARGEHLRAVKENGLVLSGLLNETVRVKASGELPPLPERALVLVTTKASSNEEAARAIAGKTRPDTVLCALQNGLDPERVFRETLSCEVLRGVVGFGCELVRPGEVAFWGGSGAVLEGTESSRAVAEVLSKAGIEARVSEDFFKTLWEKLAVNCIANPFSALLGVRNSGVVTDELARVRRMVFDECAACARASGVELEDGFLLRAERALRESNNVNSMLQDVLRGRATEIDQLNGAVVRVARSSGLQAPANEVLWRLVRMLKRPSVPAGQ